MKILLSLLLTFTAAPSSAGHFYDTGFMDPPDRLGLPPLPLDREDSTEPGERTVSPSTKAGNSIRSASDV